MWSDNVRVWRYGAVAGIVAGVTYTLSPTTLWFLLLVPVLLSWALRDTRGGERRWLLALLAIAVTARLAALAAFFLIGDRFNQPYAVLIGDERYIVDRSLWMLQRALGHPPAPKDYIDLFVSYGQSGLQDLLAYWQLWFGPAPYGAHLLNVAMWLAGAIALYRVVRRAFGPLAALGGLAVVLCTPTLFVWSISALKEPALFFLTALTLTGIVQVFRAPRPSARMAAVVIVICAVPAIASLRSTALAVTVGGLLVAGAGWLGTRRGWVGMSIVVVLAAVSLMALREPRLRAQVRYAVKVAAVTHLGHVNSLGYGYWLLDPYYYTREEDISTYLDGGDTARFVMRAAASFVTVPLPWASRSRSAILLLPQQIAWYGLALLTCVGAAAGWRRDRAFTWVLVGNVFIGAAAVALYNGNVGTLVRMRDTVIPVLAWLGALGGCVVLELAGRYRSPGNPYASS